MDGGGRTIATAPTQYSEGLGGTIVLVSRGTPDFQDKFDNIAPPHNSDFV